MPNSSQQTKRIPLITDPNSFFDHEVKKSDLSLITQDCARLVVETFLTWECELNKKGLWKDGSNRRLLDRLEKIRIRYYDTI